MVFLCRCWFLGFLRVALLVLYAFTLKAVKVRMLSPLRFVLVYCFIKSRGLQTLLPDIHPFTPWWWRLPYTAPVVPVGGLFCPRTRQLSSGLYRQPSHGPVKVSKTLSEFIWKAPSDQQCFALSCNWWVVGWTPLCLPLYPVLVRAATSV